MQVLVMTLIKPIKVIKMQEFTLTKQISKHGKQAIIVIPKILQNQLQPKTLVEIKIKVLKEAE